MRSERNGLTCGWSEAAAEQKQQSSSGQTDRRTHRQTDRRGGSKSVNGSDQHGEGRQGQSHGPVWGWADDHADTPCHSHSRQRRPNRNKMDAMRTAHECDAPPPDHADCPLTAPLTLTATPPPPPPTHPHALLPRCAATAAQLSTPIQQTASGQPREQGRLPVSHSRTAAPTAAPRCSATPSPIANGARRPLSRRGDCWPSAKSAQRAE